MSRVNYKSENDNPGEVSFSLWADSFHEGEWACRAVAKEILKRGGSFNAQYEQGFIPVFSYELRSIKFRLTVYGNYASWEPQPDTLKDLLAWGKPDLVLMREDNNEILLAVEETAATPTGNQALQRCERQYGAAREGFPFWYLIAEFGLHSDGGVRRDSIWPTMMGLELMAATLVPSIILHYSDAENPEDYESGAGLVSLFSIISEVLVNSTKGDPPLLGLEDRLETQIRRMLDFVDSTWTSSLYLVSDLSQLDVNALSKQLCSADTVTISGNTNLHTNLLVWPTTTELTVAQKQEQASRPLKKHDPLAIGLERNIDSGVAYGVIKGSGSKPQKSESLSQWIDMQNAKHRVWQASTNTPHSDFSLSLADFPLSRGGSRHVITAQRILYLFDSAQDIQDSLESAYPRLIGKNLFEPEELNTPALIYISNSVKPGRIFGDPYTGQIAAYSVSFGALTGSRKVVAYFPHQSVAQAAAYLEIPNNKGLRMMSELTDLLVFGGGIVIRTKSLELI